MCRRNNSTLRCLFTNTRPVDIQKNGRYEMSSAEEDVHTNMHARKAK